MMSAYEHILYQKQGHVLTVTLNRPHRLNALHPPTHRELSDAWAAYLADDELWVAILTGAGERAFCAGSDLKYRVDEADETALREPGKRGQHILDRCFKPIIAAINGYAVGGGLELAMRCDILIAAEHAQFGLPEARRGLLADAGGVIVLPRRLPYHTAMSLILTGRFIDAQEAHRIGLVSEVVPMADLIEAAQRWAGEVLECAPLSIQAAKQAVLSTLDLPVVEAMAAIEDLERVQRLRGSEDYMEGPRAFAEKRKPVWKGR